MISFEVLFAAVLIAVPLGGVVVYVAAFGYPLYRLWLRTAPWPRVARATLGGAMIAIPFTPSGYGHAGVVPAIVVVFVPGFDWWWRYGVIPIVMVWILASCVLVIRLTVFPSATHHRAAKQPSRDHRTVINRRSEGERTTS